MSFFDRIVAGVEFDPVQDAQQTASLSHVMRAAQLADASGKPLELVTVTAAAKSSWFQSAEEADVRAAEDVAEAQQWLKQVAERIGSDVTTRVASGEPWLQIMKAAGADPRTLIVCATKRRSTFTRVLFGSTGMKLLRYAPGPVWLVHPDPDGDDRLDIMATSDLTPAGQQVLEVAVSLAGLLPSRLHALTVAETETARRIARRDLDESRREKMYEEARVASEQKLQEQLSQTDYRTLESGVQTHAISGDADAGILQAVDNLKTNVVVMATRARGGVAGMMMGNTAERLLAALPCSALVIKPDDFQCPVDLSSE